MGGKAERGFHVYEVGTFLVRAGVSQAGGKGVPEGPAEGGSGDCPGEEGRGEEGMKGKSHPWLGNRFEQKRCSFFHGNDTVWNQVGYLELGRCLEEYFEESLRRKNVCAKGMDQLEGGQDSPERKG